MSQAVEPRPGHIVAGKYRVESEIGRGGMSVVFGATHLVTGKRFAIKWLLPEVSVQPEAASRFIRESQVSGRVQHPNLVEIFDIGSEHGVHYIVMELLEGESLADRIARERPLSVQETCRFLLPCMRGVAAAHQAGIVHRDLKPANIFICSERTGTPETVKVLDFGISKHSYAIDAGGQFTKTGTLMGTPHYMSPEQMRGKPVDQRTDIYAFGVILYQVLSGQLPFNADNFGELVMQVATEHPTPLGELVPGLPLGLEALVARAMARDKQGRPRELETVIMALSAYASETLPHSSQSFRRSISSSEPGRRISTLRPLTPGSIAPAVLDRRPSPSHRRRSLIVATAVLAFCTSALITLFSLKQLGFRSDAEQDTPLDHGTETSTSHAEDPGDTHPHRLDNMQPSAAGYGALGAAGGPPSAAKTAGQPELAKPKPPAARRGAPRPTKPLTPEPPTPAAPPPAPVPTKPVEHNPLNMHLQ